MATNFEKVCAFCEESFPLEMIKDHIAINHLGTEPQPIEESIQQELHFELQANLNRNECTLCDIGFPNRTTLKEHLKSFHNIKQTFPKRPKPPKPKCDICGKEFARNSALYNHKRFAHDGIRVGCDLCDEAFSSHNGLWAHKKRVHKGLQYSCELCEKSSYTTEAGLLEHKRKIHDIMKPPKPPMEISCDICKKDFCSRKGLQYHIRTIHEIEPCEFCEKSFSCLDTLKAHKRRVHEEAVRSVRVQCDICSKSYSRDYLPSHSCQGNGTLTFRCNACPKRFSSKLGWTLHQRNFHKEYKITAL